jgi:predicted nucleotidyltransferase
MNAELDEAVCLIAAPAAAPAAASPPPCPDIISEDHWCWRLRMAEKIASELEAERFAVKGLYLFGGVKSAVAGPGSDIDLLVYFGGNDDQRRALLLWLEGWSPSLAEYNFLRTGYKSEGLLDIHIVTDEDIARQTSFAAKIGAVTDAAKPLQMKN